MMLQFPIGICLIVNPIIPFKSIQQTIKSGQKPIEIQQFATIFFTETNPVTERPQPKNLIVSSTPAVVLKAQSENPLDMISELKGCIWRILYIYVFVCVYI